MNYHKRPYENLYGIKSIILYNYLTTIKSKNDNVRHYVILRTMFIQKAHTQRPLI